MEKQNYDRKEAERELAGYKITLRRGNPDRETARELYTRVRELETKLN